MSLLLPKDIELKDLKWKFKPKQLLFAIPLIPLLLPVALVSIGFLLIRTLTCTIFVILWWYLANLVEYKYISFNSCVKQLEF